MSRPRLPPMGCERAARTPLTASPLSPRGWYGPSAPLAGEALKGQGERLKGHGVVRGRRKDGGRRGRHGAQGQRYRHTDLYRHTDIWTCRHLAI